MVLTLVADPPPQATLADRIATLDAERFVGREDELSALLAFHRQARRTGPALVVLRGRRGVGKSTLLRELARLAPQILIADHWEEDTVSAVTRTRAAMAGASPPALVVVAVRSAEPARIAEWLVGLTRVDVLELGPLRRERPPVDAAAVRDALRNLDRPLELAESPLATGLTVAERAASARHQILAGLDAFGDGRRDAMLRDVLRANYLAPAGNRAEIARGLYLSRSVMFRLLAEAVERLTAELPGVS